MGGTSKGPFHISNARFALPIILKFQFAFSHELVFIIAYFIKIVNIKTIKSLNILYCHHQRWGFSGGAGAGASRRSDFVALGAFDRAETGAARQKPPLFYRAFVLK